VFSSNLLSNCIDFYNWHVSCGGSWDWEGLFFFRKKLFFYLLKNVLFVRTAIGVTQCTSDKDEGKLF
jgi:hypothetical protein